MAQRSASRLPHLPDLTAQSIHHFIQAFAGYGQQHGRAVPNACLPRVLLIQRRMTKGILGAHARPDGKQAVRRAVDGRRSEELYRGPHQRDGSRGQRRGRRRNKRAHAFRHRAGDIQRLDGKGQKSGGRDRVIDAPHLPQRRPLVINGRYLPDHAAERHKDDERIQPSVLGKRRAQKHFFGVAANDGIRLLVQQGQRLRQKILRCGIKSGLPYQTVRAQPVRQLGGKGLPFRLAGILTQQQAGRTGKAGQSQPDQRDKFQTGAGQPGDPAPAGREKLRQLAGQPVELDEQNQNRQHDKGGHYLQKVLQHRQPPMTREKIIRQGHMPHRLLQILSARKGCLASHPDAEPVSKASGIGAACCRPGTCCRCAADESPCRHRQQGEGVSFPTNKQ